MLKECKLAGKSITSDEDWSYTTIGCNISSRLILLSASD
jgi:hypothetical protein